MKRAINGAPFAYESHGEGVPIVFLHGLPTDHRSMVPRFEPLFTSANGSWRRVYPDLPGVGETPARPSITNMDGFVDEIFAFIEAETGGQKFALVGMSWGGYFAQAYAKRHPERLAGLALVAPAFAGGDTALPPRKVLVSTPGLFEGQPPPLVGGMNAAATVHTREVLDLFKRDIVPGGQTANGEFLNRVLGTRLSWHDEVRQLRYEGPSLIVTGRQDSMVGYAAAWELSQRLPRATYAVLDRAAHAVMMEQGELFRAHAAEWLARVQEGLGKPYAPLAP